MDCPCFFFRFLSVPSVMRIFSGSLVWICIICYLNYHADPAFASSSSLPTANPGADERKNATTANSPRKPAPDDQGGTPLTLLQLNSASSLFSPRYDAGLVFHALGLYLMGGVNVELSQALSGDVGSAVTFYQDVYLSNDDGKTWTMLGQAIWETRAAFGLVSYGEYMYLYGGVGRYLFGEIICFNDVWASTDGKTWSILSGQVQ